MVPILYECACCGPYFLCETNRPLSVAAGIYSWIHHEADFVDQPLIEKRAIDTTTALLLPGLSNNAIALLVEQANRARSPVTGVVIEYYGGAASRVGFPKLLLHSVKPDIPLSFSRNGQIRGSRSSISIGLELRPIRCLLSPAVRII